MSAPAAPFRRLAWIDACKGFAILAVVIDHARAGLGLAPPLVHYTIYSVTLFTFLGGVTNGLSIARQPPGTPYPRLVGPRLARILVPYAVASLAYDAVGSGFTFDLRRSVDHLLHFNADGVFYFVLFYAQLVAVAPLIRRLVASRVPLAALSLAAILALSLLFQRHTFVLPVHGGGRFLLGGSYFFVFALGMALSGPLCSPAIRPAARVATTALAVFALLLGFGPQRIGAAWSNPPNALAVVYTLLVFVVLFNLSAFADLSRSPLPGRARDAIAFIGKNSLTVFLYHRLAMRLVLASAWYAPVSRVPVLNEACVLSVAIAVPVAVHCGARRLARILKARVP
jgi:surface polysaccharide O-acyltransferase-like enzyme